MHGRIIAHVVPRATGGLAVVHRHSRESPPHPTGGVAMRITVHTFLTLDGVMQGPGSPEEDREGSFAAGGWMVPSADQEFGEIVESWFAKTDAVLLGRTTY